MTDELLEAFESKTSRASRFIPVLFHMHSVDSHDWGKEADSARNSRDNFLSQEGIDRFLDELDSAGVSVVCVTDHMKSAYACELSRRARDRPETKVVVLPGMEVNCLVNPGHASRIHVLAIFPEGTEVDEIERIFQGQSGLPAESQRNGQEEVRLDSLAEWREVVTQQGGILILPHIDQVSTGHRAYVRATLTDSAGVFADQTGTQSQVSHEYAEHLVDIGPHAVEIMKFQDRGHYADFVTADGRDQSVPCVSRSDVHSVEELSDESLRTYIKVSSVDLGSISDALEFHQTRVRFSEDIPPEPNPRILGIRIRSIEGGLFSEATIGFSSNLNCLIGPRGSGKSTVIEGLRHALGQTPVLVREIEDGGSEEAFASLAKSTQDANLRNSEIELIYEDSVEQRVLTSAFEPEEHLTTKVSRLDGTDSGVDPSDVSRAFPARIFSWGELETLGRSPSLQRRVIDAIDPGIATKKKEIQALEHDLTRNRAEIMVAVRELDHIWTVEDGALSRYEEFKSAFETLNTPEVAGLFEELDELRRRDLVLKSREDEAAKLAEQIAKVVESIGASRVDPQDEATRIWWVEVEAQVELEASDDELKKSLEGALEVLTRRLDKVRSLRSSIAEEVTRTEEGLRRETRAEADASIQTEQRESARKRFERSVKARDQYVAKYLEVEGMLHSRGDLIGSLLELNDVVSALRIEVSERIDSALEGIGTDAPRIKLEVEPLEDRDVLTKFLDVDFLDTTSGGGRYRANQVASKLASESPALLAFSLFAGKIDYLDTSDESSISIEMATRFVEAHPVYQFVPSADVLKIDLEWMEKTLLLQEQSRIDAVRIKSDDVPVDELSPGGRSSAMLPLIALTEHSPLIIDQPEDNLDNRMVGRTLSSILAWLKERRQIIVATHNPNIVVGGDAEQVIVLDSTDSRSARVLDAGCIDDPSIVVSVLKIMEGGADAFKARQTRYRRSITSAPE